MPQVFEESIFLLFHVSYVGKTLAPPRLRREEFKLPYALWKQSVIFIKLNADK